MKQLELRRWGGRRAGAGRKPSGAQAGVPHRRRPSLARRFPVHVTLRLRRHVYNLRSGRSFRLIRRAFAAQNGRFGFRLNQFSVQGNHLHLIVEAGGAQSLSRGVQGLAIRLARALNRLMQRRGSVFADRYHARILRTPDEVRRAVGYVIRNFHKHSAEWGNPLSGRWIDPYCSASHRAVTGGEIVPPRTWLLRAALHS
jgi:REP element-mobilizing transposase RayT